MIYPGDLKSSGTEEPRSLVLHLRSQNLKLHIVSTIPILSVKFYLSPAQRHQFGTFLKPSDEALLWVLRAPCLADYVKQLGESPENSCTRAW